jgi:Cu-processing system permease protein
MTGKSIYAIAKKEFLDNYRNKWIIAITIIFLILTLVISYFGVLGSEGWTDLTDTISGMMILVQWLIPIIALMLGYASIVGEKEKGSLSLLLSYPVERGEVIAGKFIGLGSVLALSILIGFGGAGLIIALNVSGIQWGEYLIFIVSAILLGLVYISLAMLFSIICNKRSTALGGSIFLWFLFAMIWGIILVGIVIANYGIDTLSNEDWTAPTWFYVFSMINPISSFQLLVALNIASISTGMPGVFPTFYTTPIIATVLILWILAPLLVAYVLFKRKDL